jgi:hypothetical protein
VLLQDAEDQFVHRMAPARDVLRRSPGRDRRGTARGRRGALGAGKVLYASHRHTE